MAKRYDAVVIGGGHNGLVNAAYLAKAGLKVLVLERRHILGGRHAHRRDRARFQVLGLQLRRLAASARDHPRARAGEARPGDPAARRHDHAARGRLPVARQRPRQDDPRAASLEPVRRRGLRGVRLADGRDGPVHQADPVDRAARPGQDHPEPLAAARPAREGVQGSAEEAADHVHPADDDERRRLPGPMVRDRAVEGNDECVGHHRYVPRPALAGHGVRVAPPLHGRDRRRVPSLGRASRRYRVGRLRDREQRAVAGRRDPHRGRRRPREDPGRPRYRRRALSAARRSTPTS